MPGPHDPDYTSSAGLAVRDGAEETGMLTPAKETRTVKDSRTPTRFWLVLAALLSGLAALALGFIFFSTFPGTLAAETLGAGLALLALSFLLLTGAWHPAKIEPAGDALAAASGAAPERPAEPPLAATLAAPAVATDTPAQMAPVTAPPAPPAIDAAPEPIAPGTVQNETLAVAASPAEATTAPPVTPAEPPRPATKQATGQAARRGENGHTAPTARRAPRPTPKEDAALPFPPLSMLPQHFPLPLSSKGIDAEAEDLSQLLGDIAEQSVLAVITKGQRGLERRKRLATKIDAFRREMSIDPNYTPVASFLEAIVALLHAGTPIPAVVTLVDPFDGLYAYVLTLIHRKTGRTQD